MQQHRKTLLRMACVTSLCALPACVDGVGGKDDSAAEDEGGLRTIDGPGDTSGRIDGGAILDLAWAANSSVACWPTTEDPNFEGKHVFFAFDQPEQSVLTVSLQPEAGVDLSLYLLQFGVGAEQLPPEVSGAVSCEAGYDQSNDSNPGEPEEARLTATTNPYAVIIGVAGAAGVTQGDFVLSLALEQ